MSAEEDKAKKQYIKRKIINALYFVAKNEVTRIAAPVYLAIILFTEHITNIDKIHVFNISLAKATAIMQERDKKLEDRVNICMSENNLPDNFKLIYTGLVYAGRYYSYPNARRDNGTGENVTYNLNKGYKYTWPINAPDTIATETRITPNENPWESKIISSLRGCYTKAYETPAP